MRTIERTSRFKKDYKRELKGRHGRTVADDLQFVLRYLLADKPLPPRFSDHPLSGDCSTFAIATSDRTSS